MSEPSPGRRGVHLLGGLLALGLLAGVLAAVLLLIGNDGDEPPVEVPTSSGPSTQATPTTPTPTPPRIDPREPTPPAAPAPSASAPPSAAPAALARGVRVTVVDPGGTPIEGARVQALLLAGRLRRPFEGRADSSGRVSIPIPEPMDVRVELSVAAPRRFTRHEVVIYAADEQRPVDCRLVLGEPGAVSGRIEVADGGGDPSRLSVSLENQTPPKHRHTADEVDPEGRFRFTGLMPGSYRLRAWWPGERARAEDVRVTVTAGRETEVCYRVPRFRSISASGQVVAITDGSPIAGAEVLVNVSRTGVCAQSLTDEAGRFALPDLPRSCWLRIRKPGYQEESLYRHALDTGGDHRVSLKPLATVHGEVTDPEGRAVSGACVTGYRRERVVTDAAGRFSVPLAGHPRARSLNITAPGFAPHKHDLERALEPGEARDAGKIRLSRGGAISGRVVTADGSPVAGATVWPGRAPLPLARGQVKTDQTGAYRIEQLPAGSYSLRTSAPGFLDAQTETGLAIDGSGTEVAPDLVLAPGRVICGQVVDQQQRPLPGASLSARLLLRPRPAGATPFSRRSARADAQGRFRLLGLAPGPHRVTASLEGHASASFQVEAGATRALLVLERRFPLHGTVCFADDAQPVTSFRLEVTADRAAAFKRTFLDQEGRFRLTDLVPDTYEINAVAADGSVATSLHRVTYEYGKEPAPLTIKVRATGGLVGQVWSPAGAPVDQARVALFPVSSASEPLESYGRCRGREGFRVARIPPGTYDVRASHPDWVAVKQRVTVYARQETRIDLTLGNLGGSVRVTVRDPQRRPIAGARVTVHRENGNEVPPARGRYDALYRARKLQDPNLRWADFYRAYTQSDAAGSMTRRFLVPGTYLVRAAATGFVTGEVKVTLKPGAETAAAVSLQPAPPDPTAGGER